MKSIANKIKLKLSFILLGIIILIVGAYILNFPSLIKKKDKKHSITAYKEIDKCKNKIVNLFPRENIGLYKDLSLENNQLKQIVPDDIVRVFKIKRIQYGQEINFKLISKKSLAGINYSEGRFTSYDSVEIPFYEIYPNKFDENKSYPTIVLFSGHGNMDQIAFDTNSYQKGLGYILAKQGFVVFVMENRGMGKLSFLGDHLRIDAVARMTGGSWYGIIATDALHLLELVVKKKYTSSDIGVGGVSTGGALSLLCSALDKRIRATYVQGYLGSYKTTFGIRGNHCICNNIPNIINEFDMADIGALIYPRSVLYVNGRKDSFYSFDAAKAFKLIQNRYILGGGMSLCSSNQ